MNEINRLGEQVARAYVPETHWGPWTALLGGVGIAAAAVAAATICDLTLRNSGGSWADTARGWAPMMAFQIAMAAGAIWLAGWFQTLRSAALAFSKPAPGLRTLAIMIAVMLAFTIPYSVAVFVWQPEVVIADNKPFVGMMRSAMWPAYAAIIAVGAPLSEELLFRGFLLPALTKSRIGFRGAAIVTTGLWAALHYNYSVFGLIEIFIIGLILCWALWRTGSLWAPLTLHAFNNAALAIAMKYQLLPWT